MNLSKIYITNLILSGQFESIDVTKLNQEDINYYLFFAYEKNKMQTVEYLLSYWTQLKFNNGENLLNSLVDRFYINEPTIIDKLFKDLDMDATILKYYQKQIEEISVNERTLKNNISKLKMLLKNKLSEILHLKLDEQLTDNNNSYKTIKI